ncbi:MAG: hypothetical protein IJ937_02160, partial [Treponema sp.]|nr:hypothetical protein [Treponema sp.]
MSDLFVDNIENEAENLAALEDNDIEILEEENLIFDYPLFQLKLDYSSETIYAKMPNNSKIEIGSFVVIPTRYGKDLAKVMGQVQKPVGIKQSDIVTIERKVTKEDLKKRDELIQKEKDAFPIFKEKVAAHKLDMKLITTHFLFEEPKALFFFSSDNRVDFRELVKDLVSIFKMRIEL